MFADNFAERISLGHFARRLVRIMSLVYAFFAEGFEEIEGLAVVDLLRRADIEIETVSITDRYEVTGSHNITIKTDKIFSEINTDNADMLFLPELTFDVDRFMKKVEEIHKVKKSVVIAISEGVKVADGRYVCELTDNIDYVDAFGHRQLTGTARYLAEKISKEVGCKTRAIEFNSLQRCASHIVGRVDITEAYQVGGAAVKAAFEGETGKMIILKRVSDDPYLCVTDIYDVHKIANIEKKVPREWINEEGNYVTPEFINYVRPLIQAELTPMMVDGLPRHLRLEDVNYKK